MHKNDERESLREILMEAVPQFIAVFPCHLSGCQEIADLFMVNRQTVRKWRDAGAPITIIGGRLTAEYNMLMHWHIRQPANSTRKAR